jgi:hypothetical protein
MPGSLRCVFYDPAVLDQDSRLNDLAFEACARAGVQVYALAGDEGHVEIGGERHDIATEDGSVAFVVRALGLQQSECIGVGAALAGAPVGTVWVSPLDLEIRGPFVRVAEEEADLLYQAVISELAQRR